MISAGEKAPVFVASSTEGKVDLYRLLQDGAAVLYFFPRAMTSSCPLEALEFKSALSEPPMECSRGTPRTRASGTRFSSGVEAVCFSLLLAY